MYRFRRRNVLSRGNSKCKGPEAGTRTNLVLRNRKVASVAGQRWRGGGTEEMDEGAICGACELNAKLGFLFRL